LNLTKAPKLGVVTPTRKENNMANMKAIRTMGMEVTHRNKNRGPAWNKVKMASPSNQRFSNPPNAITTLLDSQIKGLKKPAVMATGNFDNNPVHDPSNSPISK
jgi:hypothetical protein